MVSVMADLIIRDFHAHIYFDPEELEQARKFAAAAQQMFRSSRRPLPSASRRPRFGPSETLDLSLFD
jgi:aromatic ring-cleaving dioxygenase